MAARQRKMPKGYNFLLLAVYDQLLATAVELGGFSRINVLYLAWSFFDDRQVLHGLVICSYVSEPFGIY